MLPYCLHPSARAPNAHAAVACFAALSRFSKATYYKWKAQYGGMDVSALKRLKELEEENRRLKQMYAELSLEHRALKEIIEKKAVKPDWRRELAKYVMEAHHLSERQACRMLALSRSVFRYHARQADNNQIIQELLQLAAWKLRLGIGKMVAYLKNRGHGWNHKRIRRIYCELRLNLRIKPRKRLPKRIPQPLGRPERANQSWSLHFMSDSLASGRAFRTLNILDDSNREALWIEVDTSLPAERVVRILDTLTAWRGCPVQIRMDNGPELISHLLETWAQNHQIALAHTQPGKPAQNAYVERFNRTFREDVLDGYLFSSLEEVGRIVEPWIEEYNSVRPHEALQGFPPYKIRRSRCLRFSTFKWY